MTRPFRQVDVFATGGTHGNPVAVVHEAEGLTTEEMLRFTEWTNLSEATFLLPPTDPDADYRVRIFCPGRELPFAGHPTLGTCRAWLAAGGPPIDPDRVVQECGAGLIPIRRTGDRLAFAAPPCSRFGPVDPDDLAQRLDLLGISPDQVVDAHWVDNGPGWMAILLASADEVLGVVPPAGSHADFDVGLVGPAAPGSDADLEIRAFFPDASASIREDPVTGSLNASVAQWLTSTGRIETPYVAAQGTVLGRVGRIHVEESDGEVWIGGDTTVTVSGSVTL